MKIALITLSGDPKLAHEQLLEHWPSAEIVDLPRSILEEGNSLTRLRNLRRHRPGIFAVMTESLNWQYGQEALMYFGALAGARRSVIVDARRESIVADMGSLLTSGPIRIANSFLRGRVAVKKAVRRLDALEGETRSFPLSKQPGLKIAYFRTTPSAGTVPGGATSHINGVVKGLISLGADVLFVGNDIVSGIPDTDAEFRKIDPFPDVMPRAAFDVFNGLKFSDEAKQIVTGEKPSFVYERYSRFSIAGVEASTAAGVPLFLEYNGSEVWVGKHWDSTAKLDLLERYEDANLAHATRIFVVSDVEQNTLIERGVPAEKIVVNPNGVDPEKFKPGVGGDEIRRQLGVQDDELLAGFLGTFGPWHGVLELANAIALIPKSTRLKFLMVGDGSLRKEVQKRLAASDDLDRVIFTGSISHDEVPAHLDACDILVSPHIPLAEGAAFFGSPTKLFEYMAMGKGIVASRLGQIGDVLSDGETALLVEPGDPNQLARTIERLAGNGDLLTRIGKASRQAAVERHTWRQNAERVLETYRNLS